MLLINDLSARMSAHRAALDTAYKAVVDSGWLVLGPHVKAFEAAFARATGVKHAMGTANGTDALELALKALGVAHGDTVATVANAGGYTTTALLAIGAHPLYMDVDAETCTVPLAEVQRALDTGVRAIVVTHLYGRLTPDIESMAERCANHGVPLLEDCAQAHDAKLSKPDARKAGSFGTAAAFSFYPTKNLGALGDGGAVLTNDDAVAERVNWLRQYGWGNKYSIDHTGARNSRLDELQAAFLLATLPALNAENARRRDIAAQYTRGITHPEVRLPALAGDAYVAHLYVLQTPRRDALREHLHSMGIASDVHYPIPDYRQPLFGSRFEHLCLPVTERLCREILTLPCHPYMSDADAGRVIAAVNAWT